MSFIKSQKSKMRDFVSQSHERIKIFFLKKSSEKFHMSFRELVHEQMPTLSTPSVTVKNLKKTLSACRNLSFRPAR